MSGPIPYRSVEMMPEGKPFEIYSAAARRKIIVVRFKSDGTSNNFGRRSVALEGDYARMWLTDPCTMATEESLHAARLLETETQRLDRVARRKAKDQLANEAVKAKSQPARRRAW